MMLRVVLVAVAALTVGCSRPWPTLPPRSYYGRVIDGLAGTTAAGAKVEATRPGTPGMTFLVPSERIGSVTCDPDGRFSLTTTEGYATQLLAYSRDNRLAGSVPIDTKENVGGLLLTLQSPQVMVQLRSYVLDAPPEAQAGMMSIIRHMAAHPDEPLRSMQQYREQGVLSRRAFEALQGHPYLFFEPHPAVQFIWGESVFVLPDAVSPIELRPVEAIQHP